MSARAEPRTAARGPGREAGPGEPCVSPLSTRYRVTLSAGGRRDNGVSVRMSQRAWGLARGGPGTGTPGLGGPQEASWGRRCWARAWGVAGVLTGVPEAPPDSPGRRLGLGAAERGLRAEAAGPAQAPGLAPARRECRPVTCTPGGVRAPGRVAVCSGARRPGATSWTVSSVI